MRLISTLPPLLLAAGPVAAAEEILEILKLADGSHSVILEISGEHPDLLDIVLMERAPDDTVLETLEYDNVFPAGPDNHPTLTELPTGAVRIDDLGCFGCGPVHDIRSLTIAHREGTWQVIGFTRDLVDRDDPSRAAACDVNLATGEAEIVLDRTSRREAAPGDSAFPVSEIRPDYLPAICTNITLHGLGQ